MTNKKQSARKKEQVLLRKEHGSVTFTVLLRNHDMPTDQLDQSTDQQTDMNAHSEVTPSITK